MSLWQKRLLSFGLGLLALLILLPLIEWAILEATFVPNLKACQSGDGACWGVIAQKWQILLFGRYPTEEVWRAIVFAITWTALLFASFYRVFSMRLNFYMWPIFGLGTLALMVGGFGGLEFVPTSLWGGLPLTLIVSVLGMGLAFPLGVCLALSRHYGSGLFRWICIGYIEIFRALPLIAVLFLAAFVLPLFLEGQGGDLLVRVVITIACFAAAYLAEVIRGGLQSVSQGQVMAAKSLGMGFVQTQLFVVLPQSIRYCAPSLINSFVTLFKECSLVSVVSLYELTGALTLALSGDVQWRLYYFEGYLFVGLLYWVYCFGLGRGATQASKFFVQN